MVMIRDKTILRQQAQRLYIYVLEVSAAGHRYARQQPALVRSNPMEASERERRFERREANRPSVRPVFAIKPSVCPSVSSTRSCPIQRQHVVFAARRRRPPKKCSFRHP